MLSSTGTSTSPFCLSLSSFVSMLSHQNSESADSIIDIDSWISWWLLEVSLLSSPGSPCSSAGSVDFNSLDFICFFSEYNSQKEPFSSLSVSSETKCQTADHVHRHWSFTVWRDSFTSSVSLDSCRPQCFAGDEVRPIVSEPSSSFILTASFSFWQSGQHLSRLDPMSMMYWSLSLQWGSSFLSVDGPCNKNAGGLYNEDAGGSCDEDACRLCSDDACGSCIEDTCRSCNEDVCMWIRFELNGEMWVSSVMGLNIFSRWANLCLDYLDLIQYLYGLHWICLWMHLP